MNTSCVLPKGRFAFKMHKPAYQVGNLRKNDYIQPLGFFPDGEVLENRVNFPPGDITVTEGGEVFEIPNAFPFRGATYIKKSWADEKAGNPGLIRLPEPGGVSLTKAVKALCANAMLTPDQADRFFGLLPEPLLIALAQTSTDPDDLVRLARGVCEFAYDPGSGRPAGLIYSKDENRRARARIHHHDLFEILANNPHLPEDYRRAMVLRPGVQGGSEIVGEWMSPDGKSHVFEYLRQNSYIPWGHYAANMADDAVRYRVEEITVNDITGMRHLYYQRTYVRLARDLGLPPVPPRAALSPQQLEDLRKRVCKALADSTGNTPLTFNRTLWGWNFGFDYTPTRYRLHASHQQVHQQYALIPTITDAGRETGMPGHPYAYGDLAASFAAAYREETGVCFFDALIQAVMTNQRMDGEETKPSSLVIYSDDNVMLFVPKAQMSQWELNLVALQAVGNILEADRETRESIDFSILLAVRVLSGLGARMITSIECSKPIDAGETGQRLLYSFMPRLPESPGAFSESQLRWINGHYPEDFAIACRNKAEAYLSQLG